MIGGYRDKREDVDKIQKIRNKKKKSGSRQCEEGIGQLK